jgi:uncharacterized membrane protein YidH (DUF202 family)
MGEKTNPSSGDNIAVTAWLYASISLINGSAMIQHWHAAPTGTSGGVGRIILESASSLGDILMLASVVWLVLRKTRLEAAGRMAESDDERVRHIQGQAAIFAVAVIFLVLVLFPLVAKYFREVSAGSLSYAASLILMTSWVGRLVWLNRN